MATEVRLTQVQSQRMVLTPQVLTSIQLLSLPLLELRTFLQQQMVENPVLEEILTEEEEEKIEQAAETAEDPQPETASKEEHEKELDFKEEFDTLVKMDQEWKDSFFKVHSGGSGSEDEEKKYAYRSSIITKPQTLMDNLLLQLSMLEVDATTQETAEYIIGNIDDDGYLRTSTEDIARNCGITAEKVEEVLAMIQGFEPPGVGARNLREAILIQLRYLGKQDTLTYRIVDKHLEDIEKKRYSKLAKDLGVTIEEIEEVKAAISSLEPKPGRLHGGSEPQTIVPDIKLEKENGEYVITINDREVPRLRINNYYKELMNSENLDPRTSQFIRSKVKAAEWVIKCIQQRRSTIENITKDIVELQREFLDKGTEYLKPLTLREIAEKVSVHESTVSRAIMNKYVETPHGVMAMRDFFSGKVKGSAGGFKSHMSVKDKIARMIREENAAAPLTDDDIVKKLAVEGATIARRTAAKYRNQLKILPSNMRKPAT